MISNLFEIFTDWLSMWALDSKIIQHEVKEGIESVDKISSITFCAIYQVGKEVKKACKMTFFGERDISISIKYRPVKTYFP